MGKITTVLGDISPEELGYTTIHEHPFMRADSDGVLPLPEDATPEKTAFAVENLTYLKTSTCSWTLKEYLEMMIWNWKSRSCWNSKKPAVRLFWMRHISVAE